MSDEIKNPNTDEEEYQPDLMTLEDEDGNEVTFEAVSYTHLDVYKRQDMGKPVLTHSSSMPTGFGPMHVSTRRSVSLRGCLLYTSPAPWGCQGRQWRGGWNA